MRISKNLERITRTPIALLPRSYGPIIATANKFLAGCLDLGDLCPEPEPIYEQEGSVAIINIKGVILPTCCEMEKMMGAVSLKEVRCAIKQAKDNKECSHVIFNINSPGGTVTGVAQTAKAMLDLAKSKTTSCFVDELCCSAGYWLAAQTGEILCSESAELGSIGVYLAFLTEEKGLIMSGITPEVIQAGKFKTLGISCKDLTTEQRNYLQAGVDKTYAAFQSAIAGRKLAEDTQQGETYDGLEAVSLSLADGIQEDLDELISAYQK
jgi:signal peptide peptidase SppA